MNTLQHYHRMKCNSISYIKFKKKYFNWGKGVDQQKGLTKKKLHLFKILLWLNILLFTL